MVEPRSSYNRPDVASQALDKYTMKNHIDIQGDQKYVTEKIKKYVSGGSGFPGFKITDLGEHLIDISDEKATSEPQYFVVKYKDFEYPKNNDQCQAEFQVQHFTLLLTNPKTKFARMRLTSGDLAETAAIRLIFKLKKDGSATDSNKLRYSFTVEVTGCKKKNVANELCIIFMRIGDAHLVDIADKFRSKISKWADKISDIFLPNGSPSVLSKFDYQLQYLAFIKDKIENVYETFIKPDNTEEIRYLTYEGLPDGIRLFKYANQCGKGFSVRADFELLRVVGLQFGAYMDFVKQSTTHDDQYLAPYKPKGDKFKILDEVQKWWHTDEYFVRELFNGCNPFTIEVANSKNIRAEFRELKDHNGHAVDLDAYPEGDLFISRYPETRPFAYPNSAELCKTRGIYFLEPEVLTCVEGGQFKILGIGFYFGKDGTDFQVYTRHGSWRGVTCPPNLWTVAKFHAMTADSQTHEILKHLGMSHMIGETFAISHHNAYNCKALNSKYDGDNKAIGEMLAPHFVNLIAINNLARVTLIAPIANKLSNFQGVRGEDFASLIALWYTSKENLWNTDVGFWEELEQRGFKKDFKHKDLYRYFKDGEKVHNLIAEYVDKVIRAQFPTDAHVQKDKLLKLFCQGIGNRENGDIRGFPSNPTNVEQVIKTFTKIIWQVSGFHSALNFSQVQSYAYPLNRPAGLRQDLKPPLSFKADLEYRNPKFIDGDDISVLYMEETLPTNDMIFGMTEIANVLTTRTVQTLKNWASPFGRLVKNPANIASQQTFHEFYEKMQLLQKEIVAENEACIRSEDISKCQYIHLMPSNVDISISI